MAARQQKADDASVFLELYAAARRNDSKTVASLVHDQGVDIDLRFTNEYTPLMWAARVGHKDATEVLLQMEPGIDAVNLFGATALCEAVENGHADAASALLDKGADTNVQDIRGNTPMMLATRGGHIDAMRAMLDDPIVAADMGIKNEQGQTALMLAVVYQHIDAVRLLQRAPALASAFDIDNDGMGVLSMAARVGHDKIMKAVLEGVMATASTPEDVSRASQSVANILASRDSDGNTPMIWAVSHVSPSLEQSDQSEQEAEQKALACCRQIMGDEGGADTLDMPNHVGDTPLICAARLNRAALVEYLLEKNADPSLENEHKITAQFLAKELGFDRIVALCETWTVKRNQRGGFA